MNASNVDIITVEEKTHRLIPSRFPPIDLFERVADIEEFHLLHEIESLTNMRLRDQLGDITLVPKHDVIAGPGTSYIMAAFTHLKVDGEGGRFDRGFGVYYCARELETALEETKFHRAKFFRDFDSPPTKIDMRELVADLHQELHTIVDKKKEHPDIYSPDDYTAGQQLGAILKTADSWGLQYSSVRAKGTCYAVFRPPALSNCKQSKHFEYHFDGKKISHVMQKREIK